MRNTCSRRSGGTTWNSPQCEWNLQIIAHESSSDYRGSLLNAEAHFSHRVENTL